MAKYFVLGVAFLVVVGAAAAVAAAPAPVTGKVVEVSDGQVKIAIEGEKPDWVKKNAPVKFANGVGKVLEVTPDDVTPVVVTVKTKLASSMKVDDTVTFEKGRAMTGC